MQVVLKRTRTTVKENLKAFTVPLVHSLNCYISLYFSLISLLPNIISSLILTTL